MKLDESFGKNSLNNEIVFDIGLEFFNRYLKFVAHLKCIQPVAFWNLVIDWTLF